ncbi:MAG: DUF4291 family protein [Nakamurella sp.]
MTPNVQSDPSTSDVRVQWDPERSMTLEPRAERTIQVGLSGAALSAYVDRWIVSISDVTDRAVELEKAIAENDLWKASRLLPFEAPYPVDSRIGRQIGLSI